MAACHLIINTWETCSWTWQTLWWYVMIKQAGTSCNHMMKCNQTHDRTCDKPTAITHSILTHDSNLCLSMCLSTSQTGEWPHLQHMTDHKTKRVLTRNDSKHVGKHDLTHVNPKCDGTSAHTPDDAAQDSKARDSACCKCVWTGEDQTHDRTGHQQETEHITGMCTAAGHKHVTSTHVQKTLLDMLTWETHACKQCFSEHITNTWWPNRQQPNRCCFSNISWDNFQQITYYGSKEIKNFPTEKPTYTTLDIRFKNEMTTHFSGSKFISFSMWLLIVRGLLCMWKVHAQNLQLA